MNAFETLPPPSAALSALAVALADPEGEEGGRQLYRLVRDELPAPAIAEVGAATTTAALWMAAALRDRGNGCVDVVAGSAGSARLHAAAAASGLQAQLRLHELDPLAAGLAWRGEDHYGLLHLSGPFAAATWRDLFETWSRFVVAGGFLVLDGAGVQAGASQLAMNLPRWWRWTGTCRGKWVFVRADDGYPARRDYGAAA